MREFPTITEEQAIAIAKTAVEAQGWKWQDNVRVERVISERTTREVRQYDYVVHTGGRGKDSSFASVRIDGKTGAVLSGSCYMGYTHHRWLFMNTAQTEKRGVRRTRGRRPHSDEL